MRPFIRTIALAALPAVLLACAGPGGSATHTIFYDMRYYPDQVGAGGGPLPVELRGAPAGLDEAGFVAAMRLPSHVNRGTAPASPGESGPRLVIAFARASGESLCGPNRGGTAAAELTLSGAYCVGRIPYSSAITSAGGGDAQRAADSLVRVLLPLFNPEHRRRFVNPG